MFRRWFRKVCCCGGAVMAAVVPASFDSEKDITYKLVVVGGGTAGCATAAKFTSMLGRGQVAVIEPKDIHYYQGVWTMVGGGLKTLESSRKTMAEVLPKDAAWIKEKVVSFDPNNNKLKTESGKNIGYEFLVVAMGLQLNYEQIKGLPEAFDTPGVCSTYSEKYVEKVYQALKNFKEGNAIFTCPNTPIKCPGAAQKIMYLSEDYFRRNGKRDKAEVIFNTSGGVIFGVKKYAEALWKIVQERNMTVNFRHNLIEVKPQTKEAIFQNLDNPSDKKTFKYEMLHITPPMSTPDVLNNTKDLVDEKGFLEVDKHTLQHVRYKNIFGIGDCTSCPTSKTAAAAAAQLGVLKQNLMKAMDGKELCACYDGYASCPLVTGYSKCILAEFDYDGNPLETFPFNQAKESRFVFHLKKDFLPYLYWDLLIKGKFEGPKNTRRVTHLGFCK